MGQYFIRRLLLMIPLLLVISLISFMVMQQLSIQRAFAFDQHFVQAGFIKEP